MRDAILTAESELRSMETKLNLIETNEKLRALIDQLDGTRLDEAQKDLLRQIRELVSEEEDGV